MRNTDEHINGALAKIDKVVTATVQQKNAGKHADSAPTDQELALKRLGELLNQVSDTAVADLRRLRDDVDTCIREIQSKHSTLTADFTHHVECVVESVRFREIASEHLGNVRARFALPTHRNGGAG